VNHVPFPPVIHGARTGITRSGDEFLIHTEVGDLQFKPKRPFQSRATDISFITHPAPDDIPMGNVYHEMQLDGLLTLSSEAAKQSGRTSVEATLLLQGRESACLEARDFQRWLLRAGYMPIFLWGVGYADDWRYMKCRDRSI
jgi:hypothetical protein